MKIIKTFYKVCIEVGTTNKVIATMQVQRIDDYISTFIVEGQQLDIHTSYTKLIGFIDDWTMGYLDSSDGEVEYYTYVEMYQTTKEDSNFNAIYELALETLD